MAGAILRSMHADGLLTELQKLEGATRPEPNFFRFPVIRIAFFAFEDLAAPHCIKL
jgi:hypothetical protein